MTRPKTRLHETRLHMGMFDFTVLAVLGPYEDLQPYLRWKFGDDTVDLEVLDRGFPPKGRCACRRGFAPIVWLPRRPRTADEYGTLAHEAFHAIMFMFEWAGMSVTADTDETVAHAIGFLVRSILAGRGR